MTERTMNRLLMRYLERLPGAMHETELADGSKVRQCIFSPHSLRATSASWTRRPVSHLEIERTSGLAEAAGKGRQEADFFITPVIGSTLPALSPLFLAFGSHLQNSGTSPQTVVPTERCAKIRRN